MQKGLLVFGLVVLVIFVVFAISVIGPLNREASLRSEAEAHLGLREGHFDKMRKVISQESQLPSAAKNDLLVLLPKIANGREGGSAFKVIKETYPEMTVDLYKRLGRVIEAERNSFQTEQAELLDVVREHKSLMRSVWGGSVCKFFGRKELNVNVISSTEAKEVMETGIDDSTDLKLK